MPRNSSGAYNLVAGNPVVTDTLIETNWANPTLNDIAQALTDSLDRYGRGSMLAPLKFADGSVSSPGISFGSESSTGFYKPAAQIIALSVNGTQAMQWTTTGVTFAGALSGDGSGLTNLNGSAITTGIVAPTHLGTGTPDASKILYGDGRWDVQPISVPGGLSTQVQVNDAGLFAGYPSFTFDSATGKVTATAFAGDGSALTNVSASSITGVVPIAQGGTGATTAPLARTALGAAASGPNSDITSLLGITGPINEALGAPIASAAAINLTNATGNTLHLTGTTSVSSITLAQGAVRRVITDAILTFVNGPNLILPGNQNMTTAAGNVYEFVGEAGGVVRCTDYPSNSASFGAAMVAFSVYQSAIQSVASNTWTKIQLQTKEYDLTGAFDNTGNYRFQPAAPGYYYVAGCVGFAAASPVIAVAIYKNGVKYKEGNGYGTAAAAGYSSVVSSLIYLNGTTDYIELYGLQNAVGNVNTQGAAGSCYLQGYLLSGGNQLSGPANAVAFSAYQSVAQSIPNNAVTKIQLQVKEFDTAAAFDNATNFRFQPTTAGYYQISGGMKLVSSSSSELVTIYKNGVRYKDGVFSGGAASSLMSSYVSCLVYLNGSTDYVELYGYQASGAAINTDAAFLSYSYFQGYLLSGGQSVNAAAYRQIQSVSASVAGNALNIGYPGGVLDFPNAALTNGTPVTAFAVTNLSLTVPPGATLGTANGQQARLVKLIAYNAGNPVLCVTNMAGGLLLDETNLISPTTISAGATAANVIYSASAVAANSPYRVVGFCDITEAVAGTWATNPSVVRGSGGQALAALSALGSGQTWQDVKASRLPSTNYYNLTGKPIFIAPTLSSSVAGASLVVGVTGVNIGGSTAANASTWSSTTAIVPHGSFYSAGMSTGTSTVISWNELR